MCILICHMLSIFYEFRLEVFALANENIPIIEARLRLRIEMILPNDRCKVACFLELLRICPLSLVEGLVVIRDESINVTIFGSKHHSPSWTTEWVRHESIVKAHSFFADSVDIWGVNMLIRITADRLVSVVVRHYEENIWSLILSFLFEHNQA